MLVAASGRGHGPMLLPTTRPEDSASNAGAAVGRLRLSGPPKIEVITQIRTAHHHVGLVVSVSRGPRLGAHGLGVGGRQVSDPLKQLRPCRGKGGARGRGRRSRGGAARTRGCSRRLPLGGEQAGPVGTLTSREPPLLQTLRPGALLFIHRVVGFHDGGGIGCLLLRLRLRLRCARQQGRGDAREEQEQRARGRGATPRRCRCHHHRCCSRGKSSLRATVLLQCRVRGVCPPPSLHDGPGCRGDRCLATGQRAAVHIRHLKSRMKDFKATEPAGHCSRVQSELTRGNGVLQGRCDVVMR
jgi:hypothetical protein